MTTHGGHEDVTPTPIPFGVVADEADGPYRQDDAPPGAPETQERAPADGEPPMAPPAQPVPDVLAALRAMPAELDRLIRGESDEALARPASDGEWGVVEIVPHLRDWETIWQGWIRALLDQHEPELALVDDSLWSIERDYAGQPVADSLAAFAERREETVHLLETLDDETWARTVNHPRWGRLTLHQLTVRMCDHDARHIAQARDALA